jgi:uncharacterized membrane protein (UPF0127 family)
MKRRIPFLAIVFATFQAQSHDIRFENPDGTSVHFDVELAETPAERQKGLMFRNDLNTHEGMMFLYSKPRQVGMWMKNTPLSLDMIFIDQSNHVQAIEESTQPFSTHIIGPHDGTKSIVEVLAGSCKAHGISIGSKLHGHPALKSYKS